MKQLGRLRISRLICASGLAVALGVPVGLGAVSATAQPRVVHGEGVRATGDGLAENQCAVLMFWATQIHSPALGSPYSGYWTLAPKRDAAGVDDVAFVIGQDFPFAAYGAVSLYRENSTLPTGLTYRQMTPDTGSVNPYTDGTPIFAPNRRYHMVLTADSATRLAPNLAGIANKATWQAGNNKWFVLARNYNALAGYDASGTGGPTRTAWPDIRAYNARTGQPVPCGDYQLARDRIQNELSPWNTKGLTGDSLVPRELRPMLPQLAGGKEFWAPKNNPGLVEFYRMPANGTRAPNNTVPEPSDNCANYVEARLNPRRIALVRVPHIAKYQEHAPAQDATYEQPEAGAVSYSVYGQLTSTFRKNSPATYALGNEDIIQDETGGATFVVWPRNLSPVERRTVFAAARARGWNLLEGNTSGPQYSNMMIVRINGPASTYFGGQYPSDYRTGAPCMNGPQSTLEPFGLTQVPPGTAFRDIPSGFTVTPDMLFESTPQGVQCGVAGFISGSCQRRLMRHMDDTGGSYYASAEAMAARARSMSRR